MPDMRLTCAECGKRFTWTQEEQDERSLAASKDTEDEATGDLIEPEQFCRRCRPKQDQQRG
jgi:hypothetical protein